MTWFCCTSPSADFVKVRKWFHNKLQKILKEMGIPDHLTCLLRNLYTGQEVTEPDMEQQTGSKSGKEYIKAVCGHPAYLTYFICRVHHEKCWAGWSTSWLKTARRNINNLRFADDTTLMGLKSFLMKVNGESEKVGLKFNIQETKIMESSSIT